MKYEALDLAQVRTYSIRKRKHLARQTDFAGIPEPHDSIGQFLAILPQVLKAKNFVSLADTLAAAARKRPVIALLGAHVIKCGLSPVIIDLIRNGLLTHVAVTGAGAIHDLEVAFFGQTSEEVAAHLQDGSFGMVRETAAIFNAAVAAGEGAGLGERLGYFFLVRKPKFLRYSILAAAAEQKMPATVHVAFGTDTLHQHPGFDPASVGLLTHHDFKVLAASVGRLRPGAVVLNIGSAVVLPEVFLKALAVARNIEGARKVKGFTAANFDMIQHYRPNVNVVGRPTLGGGTGYSFTGHHEIMLPLLAWAVKAKMQHTIGRTRNTGKSKR